MGSHNLETQEKMLNESLGWQSLINISTNTPIKNNKLLSSTSNVAAPTWHRHELAFLLWQQHVDCAVEERFMIFINKPASPSNRSESSDIEAITCATDVDFSLRGPWRKECTRSRLTMDVSCHTGSPRTKLKRDPNSPTCLISLWTYACYSKCVIFYLSF